MAASEQGAEPDRGRNLLFPATILAISFFVIDLWLPLGVATGVLYGAVVVMGLWSPGPRHVVALALLGTGLLVLGYLLSLPGGVLWMVFANRALALVVIWSVAALVILRQQDQLKLREAYDELEDQVLRRTKDLARSEERFRSFVEIASDWYFELDRDLKYNFISPGINAARGQLPQELVGKSHAEVVGKYFADKSQQEFVKIMERRQAVSGMLLCRRAPGEPDRWAEVSASPMYDETGVFSGYRGVASEYTGQRSTEIKMTEARAQAESANRAKTDFLANMSHELRTPLNAINGYAQMMEAQLYGPMGDRHYLEYVKYIHESGDHLLSLIDDILDLTRVEAGKTEVRDEVITLSEVVDAGLRFLEPRIREKKLAVTVPPAETWPDLKADPRMVRQMLLNLLSNAMKFSPPESRIEVSGDRDSDGGLNVVVSDTGVGMSAGEMEIALERFGQVENSLSSNNEGTGLGLPLVQSQMKLHGGSFKLESQENVGTRASLLFPPERVVDRPAG